MVITKDASSSTSYFDQDYELVPSLLFDDSDGDGIFDYLDNCPSVSNVS